MTSFHRSSLGRGHPMWKQAAVAFAASCLANAFAQQTAVLPNVVVTGSLSYPEASGYAAASADSTSRTATPLKDQAASVQVVPKEVLRDRGVTRTDQLVETVSGVLAESSYGGNGATFFNIRGFSENNGLRDGFRNFGYFAFRDVQNIERVEVFKGPAGALYGGVGAVGGYVNTVSKRPGRSDFTEVGVTAGSYDLARTTLDANKTLGQDVSIRLNVAAEHNATFRDNGGYNSWSVAPAVSWSIKPGTSLTVLTEFNHSKRDGFDFGVPNVANYSQLSRTRYYGLSDGTYPGVAGDYGRNDTQAVTVLFDHALNSDWTLRAAAHYSYAHQLSTQTFPNSTTATGNLLDFTTYVGANEASEQHALRTEVLGKLNVGGLRHTVLAGVDYGYLEQGGKGSTAYGLTLDLSDPTYLSGLSYVDTYTSHQGQGKDLGIYVQDQIDLTAQWKTFVALRGDRFENKALVAGVETSRNSQSAFSPRVGLVWQPLDSTSFFMDWSRSHAPNVGHAANENTFAAEVAEQIEAGVKQQFLNNKLFASVTVFKLDRSNVLTTDPTDSTRQVLTGKQSSQGLELDVSGAITPNWKITSSYTYTDAVVKSDTNIPTGDQLSNVPRHHASIWSTHDIMAAPGFGVGAGLYYVGEREATLPNTYKLPSYVRADAALFYRRDAWRVQLNVNNVFNRKYYTGGSAGSFNYTLDPSRPRTAQLTATYLF
jgi:iron complex outermembrane receptor protein